MNQTDLRKMYGSTPLSFRIRVDNTLKQEVNDHPARRPLSRPAVWVAVSLSVLLFGVAIAAVSSPTADLFGWFYGQNKRDELLAGKTAGGTDIRFGDIRYTLDEVVSVNDGLYMTATLTPAAVDVILMAPDYSLTDPAGYVLRYGPETEAPEGTPTYVELAAEKTSRILIPAIDPVSVGVDEGSEIGIGNYSMEYLPRPDGTITVLIRLPAGIAVEPGTRYDLRFLLSARDAVSDELLRKDEWLVTVEPKTGTKGE